MYKLLLSWRYLRTRFIALASIVSVTLGVATLIVVNSVMSGFTEQMKSRLHGILSDVEISAPLMGTIDHPDYVADLAKQVVGDDLEEMTCIVRNPALISFAFGSQQWTQQVMLLGIDDDTFGKVTDFEPYLTNAIKRERFNFELEERGYDPKLGVSGWTHRRQRVRDQREVEAIKAANQRYLEENRRAYAAAAAAFERDTAGPQVPQRSVAEGGTPASIGSGPNVAQASAQQEVPQFQSSTARNSGPRFPKLPDQVLDLDVVHSVASSTPDTKADEAKTLDEPSLNGAASNAGDIVYLSPFDPHASQRPAIAADELFDPMTDQRTGIILGIAISSRKLLAQDGSLRDIYMIKPGDDLNVMFPTAGQNARPVTVNCTLVDFYSSNMHEYDSSFAFMPMSELQQIRGMIDPATGAMSFSTIQFKLKPGSDLDEVRDRLIGAFPPDQFGLNISTWEDTQRPLLSAVKMELTILNILLFLIIAVAGFGILATFFMIVVEKTKDIGILKALGAPSRGVMSIFLGYGMSLGTVGTGAGIIMGLLFVRYINEIADLVAIVTGQEVFDPTIYYFSEIPTLISPWMVVWVAFGAIMIAVLASVLPALRAARLHPVEALRYE